MSRWRLSVLGITKLSDGSSIHALERKTAALLSYLALEGATPRSKLAGLLWPETNERAARNNLSQLLRRLRGLTGEALVAGGDLLTIDSGLEVDAAALKVAMFAGDYRGVIARSGELLTNDYDDLPDFADWLYAEREGLAGLRRDALLAELTRLEEAGAYPDALALSEELLTLDPVAEEAHRRAMRLHYLAGDRAGALRAYARCRATLARELGVEPLPETAKLAAEITRGQAAVTPETKPATPQIPLRVLRPPLLVGREREWARLGDAWEAGKLIVVSGPPGAGKTRLMMDFVADKPRVLKSEGRPGDAAVPFLSLTRSFRRFFAMAPELVLEPWIAQELSRLLPDLFTGAPSAEDPLRFHEAMYHVARLVADHTHAIVIDDYQFYDSSSFESGARATSRLIAEGLGAGQARTLVAFRSGEMPTAFLEAVSQLVEQDLAVHIEIEPLSPAATAALLGSLGLEELSADAASGLANDLHRYTGGNPLFVVETIKTLLESGRLGGELPKKLPPPGKVGALLAQRLQRLSAPALHLAWTAAVAQTDFDIELAGSVLEQRVFDLAGPWRELEEAQILAGGWFSHDLLYEAVVASLPAPIRTLLHRRCAGYLEAHGALPARIAQHLLEAGDEAQAAPFLVGAAERATATFQLAEAADFFERAAAIFEAKGNRKEAFSAFDRLSELLMHSYVGERMKATVTRLLDLADGPEEQACAWLRKAVYLGKLGQGEEAERAACTGLRYVEAADDPQLRSDLLNELGTALWLQDRPNEAFAVLEEALALSESLAQPADIAVCLTNLGVMLDHLERHREAAEHHRRAAAMLEEVGDKAARVSALNNLSISQLEQGLVQASLDTLTTSLALTEEVSGAESNQLYNLGLLGACQSDLAHYREALQTFERAEAVAQNYDQYALGSVRRHKARTLIELGQFEEAGALLDLAGVQPNLPSHQLAGVWLLRAALHHRLGLGTDEALGEARRLVKRAGRKLLLCRLWLTEASLLPPEQGWEVAWRTLEHVLSSELNGLRIAAETRCAQVALALGETAAAERHSQRASHLLKAYHPSDFYLGEVLFTRYRALEASHDPGGAAELQACLGWVMNVADHHCPAEYRESFIARNPINRAVAEAAARAGLESSVS